MSSTRFSLPRVLFVALFSAATFALPAFAQDATPDSAPAGNTATGDLNLPPNVQIVGDDRDALLNLLLQQSLGFYNYPGAPEVQTTVYPGGLPDALPFDLPIPDGATLTGTIARTGDQEGGTIFFSVEDDADAVLEFYRAEYAEPDWEEADGMGGPGGGFAGSSASIAFCNSDDALIFVNANAPLTADESTSSAVDVTLNYTVDADYSPCDQSESGPGGAYGLIPSLRAPEDVRLTGSFSGGGGNDNSFTSSNLRTEFTPGELLALYNEQLAAEGWSLVSEVDAEEVAISHWTLEDDDGEAYNGLLLFNRVPGGENVYALLRVSEAD